MEPIQINVTLSFDEKAQSFLAGLFKASSTTNTAASAPAVTAAPAQTSAKGPGPKAVTLDELRAIAMTKMNHFRAEIRQKLDELNTPSLTKLDTSKYNEMYDFLNSL